MPFCLSITLLAESLRSFLDKSGKRKGTLPVVVVSGFLGIFDKLIGDTNRVQKIRERERKIDKIDK